MKGHPLMFVVILVLGIVVFVSGLVQQQAPLFEQTETTDDYLQTINKQMVSGGPSKDGIPSIDQPVYRPVGEADVLLDNNELVFGFVEQGVMKAFPKSIMYWHEVVNEEVAGEKLSITYCPLTETVIGYRGKKLGVSGKLYNSNLVVYDRASDTEIPQILGKGVNGPSAGETLETFYVYRTTWKQWKEQFPESLVLTEDTGFDRDYTHNPYEGYGTQERIFFPVTAKDDRFSSKKIVHGISHKGEYLAIPKEEFKEEKTSQVVLAGDVLNIHYDDSLDIIQVFSSGDQGINLITSFDSYWFAWYAYHPDTEIFVFEE